MTRAAAWAGEQRLCIALNRWAARRACLRLFRIVSRLGDGAFWYGLIALLGAFGGGQGRRAALHMALLGAVAALLYRGLKRATRRPRPFRAHAAITAWTAPLDEFSFPSGHTLHAVGFSLVAIAYVPPLAPLLVPFAAAVALSRVVLGLHYPSDVLAAAVIGGALAGGSLWLAGA